MHDAVSDRVLRRSKADVAADLGPKIHSDVECDLSDEQARLYDEILDRATDDGFGDGIARRGAILAALTRLKQVCNHPTLVGVGRPGDVEAWVGKLDVATDIVVSNLENDSPTIVFTQYRETGELLATHFGAVLDAPVPFLHGGLPRAERDRIVADYPGRAGMRRAGREPQKAAGTGSHPDPRSRRDPLRPLVEPRRRGAGHRPRAPDRPGSGRHRHHAHHRGHARGAHRRHAREEVGARPRRRRRSARRADRVVGRAADRVLRRNREETA